MYPAFSVAALLGAVRVRRHVDRRFHARAVRTLYKIRCGEAGKYQI
jgi:hypothetical protein